METLPKAHRREVEIGSVQFRSTSPKRFFLQFSSFLPSATSLFSFLALLCALFPYPICILDVHRYMSNENKWDRPFHPFLVGSGKEMLKETETALLPDQQRSQLALLF